MRSALRMALVGVVALAAMRVRGGGRVGRSARAGADHDLGDGG